jgi:hypothetical protein
MDGLLEDRLRLIDLKLGLEVADMVRNTAAVGAAAGIGEGEVFVYNLFSESSPVSSKAHASVDHEEHRHCGNNDWKVVITSCPCPHRPS